MRTFKKIWIKRSKLLKQRRKNTYPLKFMKKSSNKMYLQPNLIIKEQLANIIGRMRIIVTCKRSSTKVIIPSATSACNWKSSSQRSISRVGAIFQRYIGARHLFNQAVTNCAKINQHATCHKSCFVTGSNIIQIGKEANHIAPDKSQAPCYYKQIGKVVHLLPCYLLGGKESATNKVRLASFLKAKKLSIPKQRRQYLSQDGCKGIPCEKQNSNGRYKSAITALISVKGWSFKILKEAIVVAI